MTRGESDAGGCAKTTCKRGEIAVNSSAFINYGQRRCKAITSVRKTACGRLFRHEICQGDTPAPSQPQARRAADRDPAGGGIPVRRSSLPPSKSFALTPREVVSNAGAEMRLYRKVLISEAPGIAAQKFPLPLRSRRFAARASPDGKFLRFRPRFASLDSRTNWDARRSLLLWYQETRLRRDLL